MTLHTETDRPPVQIKVCGITRIIEALTCASLGVNAIGFVFYPPSPRFITNSKVKAISRALPHQIQKVGVFVDASFGEIMTTVDSCRLTAVQLHGREKPDLVSRLRKEALVVIKALFLKNKPALSEADDYDASAYLVELGQGKLPGGNARAWAWKETVGFGNRHPFILAGGLTPANVLNAVKACRPDAVDVSSGVENKPGQKDLSKIKSFVGRLNRPLPHSLEKIRKSRRIF
jgi:phosphoribosylanthranilate isomerase